MYDLVVYLIRLFQLRTFQCNGKKLQFIFYRICFPKYIQTEGDFEVQSIPWG